MSIYLSRLLLNPRSRQVISEVAYPYEMHRTLMRAFPKATDDACCGARDEFGVLFRAELGGPRDPVKVYVQSLVEPNWAFLDELKDYLSAKSEASNPSCKDIMSAYQKIRKGQLLSFRLRANPTKRIAKKDDALKGKRVELRREDEQIEWLIRKGQAIRDGMPGGFELFMNQVMKGRDEKPPIPCVRVCCQGRQTARKKEAEQERSMTHFAVLFEGLLRVTDANAFMETLIKGIGAGKAFGFGLLSVASFSTSGSEDAT